MSKRSASDNRKSWFQTPEKREERRKAAKLEEFNRYRPLQAGYELRRDYTEPMTDAELGDVQAVQDRWRSQIVERHPGDYEMNIGLAVDKIEDDFPMMTGEMMSYLTPKNIENPEGTNPESTKAFLDYFYLLGKYKKELNENAYFETEKWKWAEKNTAQGGPGNREHRVRQNAARFAGVIAAWGDYEAVNLSSDDEE